MDSRTAKRGFTLTELLVVVAIAAIWIIILLPGLQCSQDRGRRVTCINNLRQIGLAAHNFHSVQGRFPGAGQLTGPGKSQTVGGWSFLVMILPYIEGSTLYNTLQITADPTDPTSFHSSGNTDYKTAAQVATATSIPTYVCPNNPNGKYQDPSDSPPQFALTSYKAMGATCMASLNMLTQPNGAPPYGKPGMHPDGGMFPGLGTRISDITDGTAHTILCVETIDNTQSVWTLGTDVTLVGLPYVGNAGNGVIPSFTKTAADGTAVSFYMPQGCHRQIRR